MATSPALFYHCAPDYDLCVSCFNKPFVKKELFNAIYNPIQRGEKYANYPVETLLSEIWCNQCQMTLTSARQAPTPIIVDNNNSARIAALEARMAALERLVQVEKRLDALEKAQQVQSPFSQPSSSSVYRVPPPSPTGRASSAFEPAQRVFSFTTRR